MKLYLTCPVEIRGYTISCDDAGRARVRMRLFNLSCRNVARVKLRLIWRNAAGDEAQSRADFRDVAGARSEFIRTAPADGIRYADRVDVEFCRVTYEDGDEWVSGGAEVELTELPQLSGAEKNALIRAAGSDAVCRARDGDAAWRCVCGRLNLPQANTCVRCGRDKRAVLRDFSGEMPDRGRGLRPRRKRLSIRRQAYRAGWILLLLGAMGIAFALYK